MVLRLLVLLVGAGAGFAISRALRRPAHTAAAASVMRNVSSSFGGRKGLSLPELQRATFSEMMRHVRVGVAGRPEVPTHFVVRLHPLDLAAVEEAPRWFVDGLVDALGQVAASNGWIIAAPIDVAMEADPERREGAPGVLAVPLDAPAADPTPPPDADVWVPAPPAASPAGGPAPPVAPPRTASLRRLDTKARVDLVDDEVTIGRDADRDVVLDDSRVSRWHAVVRRHGNGWTVTDQGSSNGTRLNGERLTERQPTTLRSGDTLDVGPVRFRFELDEVEPVVPETDPTPAPERTMALDDVTRRRISDEYLGGRREPERGR